MQAAKAAENESWLKPAPTSQAVSRVSATRARVERRVCCGRSPTIVNDVMPSNGQSVDLKYLEVGTGFGAGLVYFVFCL